MPRPREEAAHFRPRDLMRALRAKAWIIVTCTVVAVAATIVMLAGATPRYAAYSQMLLGEQGLSSRNTFDLVESQSLSNTVIEGELAVLQSNALLVRVARRLELDTVPEFNPDLLPPEEPSALKSTVQGIVSGTTNGIKSILGMAEEPVEAADEVDDAEPSAIDQAAVTGSDELGAMESVVGKLRNSISVRQLGSSYVVQVSASSSDPRVAAAIVNTLMDEYISFLSDKRFQAARRFSTWLETRVEGLAEQLEASERDVFEFRATMDAEADSRERLDQQLRELTSRLVAQRSELAEVTATLEKMRNAMDSSGPMTAANLISSDEAFEYRAELGELNRRKAAAISNFGEDSPQVLSIERSINSVEEGLSLEVEREIARLENSTAVLGVVVSSLEASMRELSTTILGLTGEEIELNQLQRIVDANQRVYQEFLGRFREANEIQNLQTPDADVISYAGVPNSPVYPRKKLSVILAGVGGMFAGIMLILMMEMAPKKISTAEQLSRRTGVSVYGRIPRLASRSSRPSNVLSAMRTRPDGPLAHAALRLASNADMRSGGTARSIVLSSIEACSDKSLAALMLGWAKAHRGYRCVVVDADIRRAELTTLLGDDYPMPEGSLAQVLYGECHMNDAVIELKDLGFYFMPTIPMGSDPAVVFDTAKFQTIMDSLLDLFDVVILDAPAAVDLSDAFLPTEQLDIGLFIVPAGQSTADDLEMPLRISRSAGVRNHGLVLSRDRTLTAS
ncbi:GumC family protein [Marinibacterium profundimaris]|uniref:Uncharacterized protein n=1 Tax=Marinibacterium profundimaris TaxID=1679460 RepID=A0A225NKG8_9RHOB|nr:GNVR domain-containing protein [Marinibacterium profundimaris]OWU72820.1 hypothetical protein ATO3_13960 [Marinibacterium profundimaris]